MKINQEIINQAHELKVSVQVGKAGINESTIQEIKKQLEKRELVKIKLLKSFISNNDKATAFEKIISDTKGKLVLKRGFTITLYKKKPNRGKEL